MTGRPRLLIADDHPVVVNGLAASLREWYTIVETVSSLDTLDERLFHHQPELVLLDISFGDRSSLRLLPTLVDNHPDTQFVMLTAHTEPVLVDAAFRAGALGFVVKESPISEIRTALEEALAGHEYVSPLVRGRRGDTRTPREVLERPGEVRPSERQLEILMMLRGGSTHREIADELDISTKTIEYHLDALRRRVGIASIGLLIQWAEQFEKKKAPRRIWPRRGQGL